MEYEYIRLYVAAGARIYGMFQKACVVALDQDCLVRFTFNGQEYSVKPEDIKAAVKKDEE